MNSSFLLKLHKIHAHGRLWIGIIFASLTFVFTYHSTHAIRFILTWSSFSIASLLLFWTTIFTAEIDMVKHLAKREDSSRGIAFLFVLFSAIVSLFAVIILLRIIPNRNVPGYGYHIGFSILSVVLSWFLIHTVFAFKYAHLYYGSQESEDAPEDRKEGGLEFPSQDNPDYLDFAYFSFVIGMTFQVSDVTITSRKIRHLALLHGLISFVYNTVIFALSVNIIYGLIQK